ncbi:MAG TPA: hypothetical protein VKR24_12745 [Candidatus Limnocylindrales bacterium]|nr:hypothetical protein [Candidatus Limnocylindrales bacterium]
MSTTLAASPDELVIEYRLGDVDVIRVAVEPEPADVVEFKRQLSLEMLEAGPGSSAAERAMAIAQFGGEHGYVSRARAEDDAQSSWTVHLGRVEETGGARS